MHDTHRKVTAASTSVAATATLALTKLSVGFAIGSVSVISEALHSAVDVIAALITLFAVKTAARPPDADHPFGHGKIENISGTIEALLIFVAAGWIVYEAVKKLLHPLPLEAVGWGVGVMLVSVVVNFFVSRMLFKVGRQTDSRALEADGWHLLTDVWTSGGVMAALAAIWLARRLLPGTDVQWLDPVAAIGVALLIVRAAYKLTLYSARDLLDVQLPPAEVQWIESYLSALGAPVCGYHGLRTRKAGSARFIELHLLVNPQMSVQDSHDITERIARDINAHLPRSDVTIHIEPAPEDDRGKAEAR